MTKAESLAEFKDYIDDATVADYHHLERALLYLNNFFFKETFDSTRSTVIDQNYVEWPGSAVDVLNVWVDDDEIKKLKDEDLDNIAKFEEEELKRWYNVGLRVYFTWDPDAVETVKMKINEEYEFPTEVDGDYDCPNEFLELVILGAVKRYYTVLMSRALINPTELPDITPFDVGEAKRVITKEYNDLIRTLRQNTQKAGSGI